MHRFMLPSLVFVALFVGIVGRAGDNRREIPDD